MELLCWLEVSWAGCKTIGSPLNLRGVVAKKCIPREDQLGKVLLVGLDAENAHRTIRLFNC